LASHECGQAKTDSHAADEKSGGGGDVGHAEAKRSREQQNDRQAVPGPDDVADGAHEDTSADRSGHGGEAGGTKVRLSELKVFSDDGDHWCRSEGRHERHEEAHPGHVKGRMVREIEGEDVEALRLVFAAEGSSQVEVSRSVHAP